MGDLKKGAAERKELGKGTQKECGRRSR